ncbi:D-lactate dehydrogenase [Flaviramulus aquimarinus]|uniref:D-lactate dehydrogenase n=1 Tax=Flaviramulus aquimarinus TaxID=1170456 RepID=A0ABP9ESD9_9FLAO
MKVLVYSAREFDVSYLETANKKRHKLIFTEDALSSETAIKAVGFAAISIMSSDNASDIVIEKLEAFGVKYITLRSVGYDNVNLNTAKRLKLKVANVPEYSPYAIAEHAVSLLLALNRKLIVSNSRVKQFNFDINNLIGFDLNNKTVGIMGTGKIGSVFTKIMHGFGCKLLAFDIEKNQNLIDDFNVEYVSLKTLCKTSDILSLHVPLNTETYHLINKELLDLMKVHVVIINTARGAVIKTIDIIKALENKSIAALGMDVYEHEKSLFFRDLSLNIPKDDILIKLNALPNVLITGHHAFLTEEALTNIAETTIYNLDCWSKNSETENELTSL